jgi:hypothetical protein
VSGRALDFARRTRFFGLRRVEAISLDRAIRDQELQQLKQNRAQARNRVSLMCAGDVVQQFCGAPNPLIARGVLCVKGYSHGTGTE